MSVKEKKKFYLPYDDFQKFVELNKKKLSIALFENFPFSKELKNELDKIISLDKVKNYYNDENLIINYKYLFYNEFYNFLFFKTHGRINPFFI